MIKAEDIKIDIDGTDYGGFMSCSIWQEVYAHHHFELVCRPDVFHDWAKVGDSFILRNAGDKIGKKVSISINYLTDSKSSGSENVTIFKGIILEVEGTRHKDAWSGSLIFKGVSLDYFMNTERRTRVFEDIHTKDLYNDLIKENLPKNLLEDLNITSKNPRPIPYIIQYQETNYELLYRITQRYGDWMLMTSDNRLYLGDPPDKVITIEHNHLMEFSFSETIIPIPLATFCVQNHMKNGLNTGMEYSGETGNNLKKAMDASTHTFPSVESQEIYYYGYLPFVGDTNKSYDEDLELVAKCSLNSRMAQMNIAIGKTDNPRLSLGCKLDVKGENLGEEFRIISIYHSFDEAGNYFNRFKAIPASVEVPPQANPNIRCRCESQYGIVKDNDDPKSLGRVKVSIIGHSPFILPWLRIATPYSGDKRGIHFIPEIGDEVLVGFENDNVEKPYIIGSLYNGQQRPASNWDPNVKAIRSRSGHTIKMIDEDGKEKIEIYDKDKTSQITFTPGSEGNELTIHSKGEIIIGGDSGITIKDKDRTNVINVDPNHASTSFYIVSEKDCSVTSKKEVSIEAESLIYIQCPQGVRIASDTYIEIDGKSSNVSIKGGTINIG